MSQYLFKLVVLPELAAADPLAVGGAQVGSSFRVDRAGEQGVGTGLEPPVQVGRVL